MPLNPLYIADTLPATSEAAIREFQDRYLAAIGASEPNGWADDLGDLMPTDSPYQTFPVNQLRTQYKRSTGESHFKKLGEASFDVKTEEFDDGYQALLMDVLLKVFAYRQWQQAPSRFVTAENQHRHVQIARILDGTGNRGGAVGSANDPGGLSRKCVDGQNFFSTSHPANITDPTVTGTWGNYQGTATNVLGSTAVGNKGTFNFDNIQTECVNGETSVLDENGLLLGVDYDTILVPYDYKTPLENGLKNTRIMAVSTNGTSNDVAAAAIDNPYLNKFKVVGVREFTTVSGSTADWYLADSKLIKKGVAPWMSMRQMVPASLGLRVFDESSDFFKNTSNIKVSSHIWYGFSLVLPHAIRRIKGPTR